MQRGKKKNILKRLVTSFILVIFFGVDVFFGLMLQPNSAKAQVGATVVTGGPVVVETGPITKASEESTKKFTDAIKEALAVGFKNSIRYFTRKVATDFAKHLATKAAGQESLYFEQGWTNYLAGVADGTAGTFIDALGDLNGFAKINFCEPDLAIRIALSLGLKQYGVEEPVCTISKLKENWGQYVNNYNFLENFQFAFSPQESDFGAKLGLQTKMIELITAKEREALLKRWDEKANKDLEDALTGGIRTPGAYITAQAYQSLFNQPGDESLSWTGSVVADTVGAFSNTFIVTLSTLLLQGLIAPSLPAPGQLGNSGGSGGNPASVEAYYASVAKPDFRSAGLVDILGEFLTCPDVSSRTSNNCVIDEGFQQAAQQHMTVREAIDAGFLHGDWAFGYSDPQNKRQPDVKSGYALNNMKKLRAARVIPVGWELAAQTILEEKFTSPVTLSQAVNAFNDCSDENGNIGKLCKLVDPNWVLKAPLQRCDQKAYGPTVLGAGGSREEICVDTKTCIEENADGTCADWGYCTREKNIWRFPGDSCPAQYNSCETFTDADGDTASYLENTVDKAACDASNTGCAWYCDAAGANGNWTCSIAEADARKPSNAKKIFNAQAERCDAQGAGCTELVSTSASRGTNLVANGSFEEFSGTPDDGTSDTAIGVKDFLGANPLSQAEIVSDSLFGNYALALEDQIFRVNLGTLRQNAAYTASVWFKASSGTTVQLSVAGAGVPGGSGTSSESAIVSGNNAWKRIVMNPIILTARGDVSVGAVIRGGRATLDGLQFEEGFSATDYSDYGSKNSAFLKKAPEYLDCVSNPTLCANYAPKCEDAEVGCELYTPANGDPAVPGQVRIEDYCPAECVGYDTFVESPTDFTAGSTEYFIPSTARSCGAEAAGCTQFTNLETEQIENYSSVRHCILPSAQTATSTFYTWEGSDENGYRLEAWSLKSSSGASPDCLSIGSCRGSRVCDETVFRAGTNPDCREFFNAQGAASYALYSETVTVSTECSRVRQTTDASIVADERQKICEDQKNGTWDANTQSCVFSILPIESNACAAAENGCREYKGNAAENVAIVMNDTFENGTDMGWKRTGSVVSNSNESLNTNGKSLKVTRAGGGTAYTEKDVPFVRSNAAYQLSFWAKGAGNITASFESAVSELGSSSYQKSFGSVELDAQWRQYAFDVIDTGSVSDARLASMVLRIDGFAVGSEYYFDNIIVKEVRENLYLVKDSWKTPMSCNNVLGDAMGEACGGTSVNPRECAPQIQLGCEAYADRKGNTVNVKSFDNLCREEAVGCEEFVDTKNNDTPFAKTYHAVCWRPNVNINSAFDCERGGEKVCSITPGETSCYYDVENEKYTPKIHPTADRVTRASVCTDLQGCLATQSGRSCWVAFGKTSCLQDGDESTVSVPADALVYLVRDEKYACTALDKGCKALGVASVKPGSGTAPDTIEGYATTYMKDDPEKYGTALCSPQALSCKEYKSTAGTVYFKDPGNKLCEYRDRASGGLVSGWFRKGTDEPCYSNLQTSEAYGIFKNADVNYRGFAGVCQEQYAGCEEFVDRAATSEANPEGEPYYFIDNQALANAKAECAGKVGLNEGCTLFDQTGNPNKYWNSAETYALSQTKNNALVDPVKEPFGGIDSNLILKVNRDRVCSAWLECTVGETVADPVQQNRSRDVCYALDEFEKKYNVSLSKFEDAPTNNETAASLSAENYKNRPLEWSKQREYTGYSIPNFPPADALNETRVDGEYKLTSDGVSQAQTCRAYPQSTSPFPSGSKITGLPSCATSGASACDCSYIEADAGGEKAYYNKDAEVIPQNICTRPDRFGEECAIAERKGERLSGDCVSGDGQEDLCRRVRGTKAYQGWEGYCLEKDVTRPLPDNPNDYQCLQWYPLDVVRGSVNLFDYNTNAVYTQGPEYYCYDTEGPFSWYETQEPGNITNECRESVGVTQSCPSTQEGVCKQACENTGTKEKFIDAVSEKLTDAVKCGILASSPFFGLVFGADCDLSGLSCSQICNNADIFNQVSCTDGNAVLSGDVKKDVKRDDVQIFSRDTTISADTILRAPSSILGYYRFEQYTTFRYNYIQAGNPLIYEDQIQSMQFQVESSRSGEASNLNFSHCFELDDCLDDGDDCLDLARGRQTFIVNKAGGWNSRSEKKNISQDPAESDQGSLEFQARFDAQNGKFIGIDVVGFDKNDQGSFIVLGYKINFKNSCSSIVRVKKGSEIYAYTASINDIKKKLDDSSGNEQDRISQIQPWGATAGFAKAISSDRNPPLDTLVVGETDSAFPYSGALWSGETLFENFFGKYFERWGLNKTTLEYSEKSPEESFIRTPLPAKIVAPTIQDVSLNGGGPALKGQQNVTRATLEFYLYDQTGEALPIRKVTIDWGDDTDPQSIESAFGNYMSPGSCDKSNWGRDSERCRENKLKFTKVYHGDCEDEKVVDGKCEYKITISACNNLARPYREFNPQTCVQESGVATVIVPKK